MWPCELVHIIKTHHNRKTHTDTTKIESKYSINEITATIMRHVDIENGLI